MTVDEAIALVGRVTFNRALPIMVKCYQDRGALVLECRLATRCVNTGKPIETARRYPPIVESKLSEELIVDRIRWLAREMMLHEVDECMQFDGRQIQDPHEGRAVELAL